MSFQPIPLASVAIFKGLAPDSLHLLEERLQPVFVRRGDQVVRQGEDADALFVVVSGRFAVEIEGHDDRVAEISRGSTIGEIAFFTGGPRTATVRAIRDGVVVRLTRADFNAISASSPSVLTAITVTLAERLAAETRRSAQISRDAHTAKAPPRPRTIAVIGAAGNQIPAPFLTSFIEAAKSRTGTLVVSSSTIGDVLETSRGDLDLTDALNSLENRFPTIIFLADDDLTAWSEKAIRQADELMIVAQAPADPIASTVPLSKVEAFALTLHQPRSRRLVIVHDRKGSVQGTHHWLRLREPQMHHHVALREPGDIARLWRFLSGDALGFVACGGGAYCAAHVGVYRAFREADIPFDFIGGTSGGAAMGAAFAQHIDPLEIDARVHRMFITGRALGRYTLPRYGLLDHAHFDSHLQREYGDLRIEDLWTPFFAVSADLTRCEVELHRTGELWRALRASAAIPGLLPPYYTDDGRVLVDGSVVANVPIETMHSLKRGPNVVVSFETAENERPVVDYAALPGRAELIWKTLNPAARGQLPRAPSAASVLVKSLMANRSHFERHLEPDDWLLAPPVPQQMGALDWRRHTELMETAYQYARAAIASRPRP